LKNDVYHTGLLNISLLQAGATLVGITSLLARRSKAFSTVNLNASSAPLMRSSKVGTGDMVAKAPEKSPILCAGKKLESNPTRLNTDKEEGSSKIYERDHKIETN
jgi:hypothetical protein